ncbi:hypothetical protein GCM10027190_04990 [Spirosoma areae]
MQSGAVSGQKPAFVFVDLSKLRGSAPVAHGFGADPVRSLTVVVIEMGMARFGQPDSAGLPPLHIGALAEAASP